MSAFAIFCSTDGSLIFYNRDTVPSVGGTIEGKTVSNVYTGFDTASYTSQSSTPWYNERQSIISVSFMPEFATIKPISTAYWFQGADNMTSFDGTNLNTSNVTDMMNMFRECKSLSYLNVSGFNTSKVTSMHQMFYFCKSLTSLDLSSFDTSKVTNMKMMFYTCSNLTTIYASNFWTTNAVTNNVSMFASCNKLVGAIPYNSSVVDKTHANYQTGYLTYKFYYKESGHRFVVSGSDLNKIANTARFIKRSEDGMTFDYMIDILSNIRDAKGVQF